MTRDRFLSSVVPVLKRYAREFGARSPEDAAQEALQRSLSHEQAGPMLRWYFGDDEAAVPPPDLWDINLVYGWLRGVVRNVVREERRRDARELQGDEAVFEVAADARDVLASILDKDLRAALLEAVNALVPEELRRAVVMRLTGASQAQIAAALGLPTTTINNWIHRGTKRIRDAMKKRMEHGQ